MVSSTGARVLAAALVIALGQLLLSSVPTFIGSAAPRGSHQLRLASGRQQEFQGSKVTAQFFKKMLNRKKQANVRETAPDNLEVAVVTSTDAALEEAKPAALDSVSMLHAQVAEPIATHEQPVEPAVNLKIDDAVPSQQVEPVVNLKIDDTSLDVASVESAREATTDDFIFNVAEVESPVTSLLKTEDAIYDFFVELTDSLERLWNTRYTSYKNPSDKYYQANQA